MNGELFQKVGLAVAFAAAFMFDPIFALLAAIGSVLISKPDEAKMGLGKGIAAAAQGVATATVATKNWVAKLAGSLLVASFFGLVLQQLFLPDGFDLIPNIPTPITFQYFMVIVPTLILFYLWLTGQPHRWMYWCTVVGCCAYLAYTTVIVEDIRQDSEQASRRAINVVVEWWSSRNNDVVQHLDETMQEDALKRRALPIRYTSQPALLYHRMAGTFIEASTVETGTAGRIDLTTSEAIIFRGRVLVPWYGDIEDASKYIELDLLARAKPEPALQLQWHTQAVTQAVLPQLPLQESPLEPETTSASSSYRQPVAQPAIHLVGTAPVKSTVKQDIVVVTAQEWTNSEIVPYIGDVIEFGPFKTAAEVDRLLCRTGGGAVVDLDPIERWDGMFIGRGTVGGGANLENAPLRLKVEQGDELVVPVQKTKMY